MKSTSVLGGVLIAIIVIAYLAFVVYGIFQFADAYNDGDTHVMTFWGFILVFLGLGGNSRRS